MRNDLILWTTFILAFALTLLPMPEWAEGLHPAWVLLVLIYWNINAPYRVNVGKAWCLGIFLDVLYGSLLGEHALAMTLVSYFVVRLHARLKMFSLLQQGLCVLFFVFVYQLVIYCVQGCIGELPRNKFYWISSMVSMLLWPWIVSILSNLRRHFRIA